MTGSKGGPPTVAPASASSLGKSGWVIVATLMLATVLANIASVCMFPQSVALSEEFVEEDDINTDSQMYLLFPEERCIEPLGESFSDYEIVCMIAERLGLSQEYRGGKSIPELIRLGYETSGMAHLIIWDELREKGYFVVPTDPDWEKIPAGLTEFYEDPEKHPLTPPPVSSSSTPPAWPSTSPVTWSGRRSPDGSRRASLTRRPSEPSGRRATHSWS